MKFCFNQLSGFRVFRGEVFEILDGRTTDGAYLYYELPRAFGSGELKR